MNRCQKCGRIIGTKKHECPTHGTMLNKRLSKETREKISIKRKGTKVTDETKAKVAKSLSEYHKKINDMPSRKIKIGQTIGKLTILEELAPITYGSRAHVVFKCVCDCGNIKTMLASNLQRKKYQHRISCGCSMFTANIDSAIKRVFDTYKTNARKKGRSMLITYNDFKVLTGQDCYYCGNPPQNVSRTNRSYNVVYIYNGLDRKNSEQDYTLENCVPCCRACNIAKHTMSEEMFLNWVERIYLFSIWPKQRKSILQIV